MRWMSLAPALVGLAVAVAIMPLVMRSRNRSLMAQGRLEVGITVLDGAVEGLPRRWQHGIAQLGPYGQLTFSSYAFGLRPFPRQPVTLWITSVVDPTLRAPGFSNLLSVAFYCRTMVLATQTGTVQVAVMPEVGPWLLGHLAHWGQPPVGARPVAPAAPTAVPTAEGFLPPA